MLFLKCPRIKDTIILSIFRSSTEESSSDRKNLQVFGVMKTIYENNDIHFH